MNFLSILGALLADSGFAALTWQSGTMILISFVLMYLAIVKKFEPLLLLPIAFGMFLSNLPLSGTFSYFYEIEHWYEAGIIGVMYMGSLVEVGDADEICERPVHPYTQILMSAVPVPDPVTARLKKTNIAVGEVPSPIDLPKGCPFAPRCQYASWQCRNEKPPLQDIGGRQVACYYAD